VGEVKKRELFSRDVIQFADKPFNEETACLSDLVTILGTLSQSCATLEYQNNGNESLRAAKACLELERKVAVFKKRIRDVRAEILLSHKK
jgi:hypothetical protein